MFYVFESAPSLPNLDFDEFLHFHILSYSTKSKYTRKMYSYEKIHLPISIILSLFVYNACGNVNIFYKTLEYIFTKKSPD